MRDNEETLLYKMRTAEIDSWQAEGEFLGSLTAAQKHLYYSYCEKIEIFLSLKEKYEKRLKEKTVEK